MEFLMLGSSDGGEAEIDEKVMGEHCPRTMAAGDCLMDVPQISKSAEPRQIWSRDYAFSCNRSFSHHDSGGKCRTY
jgi:hypothetical protein